MHGLNTLFGRDTLVSDRRPFEFVSIISAKTLNILALGQAGACQRWRQGNIQKDFLDISKARCFQGLRVRSTLLAWAAVHNWWQMNITSIRAICIDM